MYLCGHNAKEFDIPFLARHDYQPNSNSRQTQFIWQNHGKFHLDTLELWKFGDYKHYTS
jgi:hypothetical protein